MIKDKTKVFDSIYLTPFLIFSVLKTTFNSFFLEVPIAIGRVRGFFKPGRLG
jgi:hypothetical protein